MGKIRLGTGKIGKIYLESTPVKKLYAGTVQVWQSGYDAYNIVVREGENVVLYDVQGGKLNEINSGAILRMAADDYYIYVLWGDQNEYRIKMYDFSLNEVDSVLLPDKNTPNMDTGYYANNNLVAANKKMMFNSKSVGPQMGFIDLNKDKSVHYVDVTYAGSAALRQEFYYDKNTDCFYSRRGDLLQRLNETTYEWEDTDYLGFISNNPTRYSSWHTTFIGGLSNMLCCGEYHLYSESLQYIHNNKEKVVKYNNTKGDLNIISYVMLDEKTPFFYAQGMKIGTVHDLLNPIVEVEDLEGLATGRYGYSSMYKHPYKNIILIPLNRNTIPEICVYDYDLKTYTVFQCTYKATTMQSCNAITVPKQ